MRHLKSLLLAVSLFTPALARAQDVPAPSQASAERRGWFGVSLTCSECYIQRGAGRVAYTQAPAISSVESGSPAHQAGLRNGDTIIAVEGLLLTTPEGFERFATARGGVSIRLTVRKAGEAQREVTVVPSERQSSTSVAEFYNERLRIAQRQGFNALRQGFRSPLGWLGLQLECENCSVSTGRRMTSTFRQHPAVVMVDVDGPAHRGGVRRGDTLTAIDGVDLATSAGGRLFAAIEPDQRVAVTLRRGGAERRITLVAVARPDASQQEIASFNEYKRMRDSADSEYRQVLGAHVQRASLEIRELERMLRELETNRSSVDSSRRRLSAIDSVLRSLRRAESERARMLGSSDAYSGAMPTPRPMVYAPLPPVPPTPTVAGQAPTPPVPPNVIYPVRYSNRLRNLVNVEARSPGGVTASEEGDSVVVLYMPGGASVRVTVRR